jgi:IMP dehydrogenase/GMP reductase
MTRPFPESLTFEDVLLKPAKSSVLPKDACTHSRLTQKIPLAIPIISAAMVKNMVTITIRIV